MASRNEEYIAVAAVLISLIILSLFFGLFWSFLLVFTFLFLAYKFGRPEKNGTKITTRRSQTRRESRDLSLNENEVSLCPKGMDVPFTGLPNTKQSLRSPMPLLSAVTKRLSFNTSSYSPHTSIYRRKSALSPAHTMPQQQSQKYFSLINPSLMQQTSTVKIASPDYTNIGQPVKILADKCNPLSRTTILSALKQSTVRKRSALEEDEEDDLDNVNSQTGNHNKKRRYQYHSLVENNEPQPSFSDDNLTKDIPDPPPITRTRGIYSLIETRLKRKPLHDGDTNTSDKGRLLKKTKQDFNNPTKLPQVNELNESNLLQHSETVRNDSDSTAKRTASNRACDDDSDSGCDADDDDDVIMKPVLSKPVPTERLNSKKQTKDKVESEPKRKRFDSRPTSTPKISQDRITVKERRTSNVGTPERVVSKKQRLAQKQRMVNTSIAVEVTETESTVSERSSVSGVTTPKKRFTVIRFPSKTDESKRRPIPVYCASVNTPELPQRHSAKHKITKEDIELDRKLAWQRVQSFLDCSDEEEDQAQGDSSSVAIHVTTCLPSPSRSMASSTTSTGSFPSELSKVTHEKTNTSQISSTIGLTTVSTQPSPLLSALAASKPSIKPTSELTQSQASSTTAPPAYSSKPSSFQTTAVETGSSIGATSTVSGFTIPESATLSINKTLSGTIVTQANSFGLDTSKPTNPTFLTSLTTSSPSIQTPICTPATQGTFSIPAFNTAPAVTSAPASISLPFGLHVKLPQVGSISSNPPQMGLITSNPAQVGLNLRNLPQDGVNISNLPQGGVNTKNLPQGGVNISNLPQGGIRTSNLPQGGVNTNNLPQGGVNTSNLLQGGVRTSNPSVFKVDLLKPGSGSSLFSGLTASPAGKTPGQPFGATTTLATGGFSFNQQTSSNAVGNTFPFASNQQPSTNAPSTFGPQATGSTQNAFGTTTGGPSNTPTRNAFGATVTATPTAINMFGASVSSTTQNAFGAPSASQNAFGAPSASQNAFGGAKPTGQGPFVANTPQNAFVGVGTSNTQGGFTFTTNAAPPNTFGKGTKPTTGTTPIGQFSFAPGNTTAGQSQAQGKAGFSFGGSATKNVFGAAAGAQSAFGAAAPTQNAFGSPAANALKPTTTQNAFGAQNTQGAFGAQNTQGAFGAQSTQGAFGAQSTQGGIRAQSTQSAFGAQNTQVAFGTQNTQGVPGSQNVFGSSSQMSGTPAGASTAGGFNFGGNANSTQSPGGFQFAPGFNATPAAAAPSSGGFNFGAGTQPTAAPAFGGGASTAFKFASGAQPLSASVARARPKATPIRRRPRK